MATSKYGLGKYSFRLYSAVPFVDYISTGAVTIAAVAAFTGKFAFVALGAITVASTNVRMLGVRGYSALGPITINAVASLWTAHTMDFAAVGAIVIDGTLNLSYRFDMKMTPAPITVTAVGEAYLGPFWNEKDCTPDVWDPATAPVSPWGTVKCTGSWSDVTDG